MGDNMNKLTNDQNIKNLKRRKILRYLIIFLGVVTIVLAILALTIKLNFVFSLISFIIMTVLTKKRESIPIKISKDLEMRKIERSLKKHKRK